MRREYSLFDPASCPDSKLCLRNQALWRFALLYTLALRACLLMAVLVQCGALLQSTTFGGNCTDFPLTPDFARNGSVWRCAKRHQTANHWVQIALWADGRATLWRPTLPLSRRAGGSIRVALRPVVCAFRPARRSGHWPCRPMRASALRCPHAHR